MEAPPELKKNCQTQYACPHCVGSKSGILGTLVLIGIFMRLRLQKMSRFTHLRFGVTFGLAFLLASTTLEAVPTATTLAASNVTPGGVTLSGTAINNSDTTTRAWFQYGLTTDYGSVSGKRALNGLTGTTPVNYSNSISGLLVGTLYHFSAIATNGTGTSIGADLTFITLPATTPTITTNYAGIPGITNVTLNGQLNANGLASGAWFEWGITTNYGNVTTTTNLTGGTTNQNFKTTIGGLDVGVAYYFRAVATNSLGATYGTGQSFTPGGDASASENSRFPLTTCTTRGPGPLDETVGTPMPVP
jgi:hypothetical protein